MADFLTAWENSAVTTGYCSTNVASWSGVDNHETCHGSYYNIGYYFGATFSITVPGSYGFRYGADLGCGGILMLDGELAGGANHDMWWNYNWNNPSQYVSGTRDLVVGDHMLEVVGFEGCCDGQQKFQLHSPNMAASGWVDLVNSQASPYGITIANPAPIVRSIYPASYSTVGGTTVTINGLFFGIVRSGISSIYIGNYYCPITIDPTVFKKNRRTVTCTLPAGMGTQPVIIYSADYGNTSPPTKTIYFQYSSPILLTATASIPTVGGTMTLTGTNLGVGPRIRLRGGSFGTTGTDCTSVSVNAAHTSLTCAVPAGSGAGLTVQLLVCSYGATCDPNTGSGYTYSPSLSFSFAAPTVSSWTTSRFATQGGSALSIGGSNFGPCDANRVVTVGGKSCSNNCGSSSHYVINCNVPAGNGLNLPIVININGQSYSSASFVLSYLDPTITGGTLPQVYTEGYNSIYGDARITLTGTNFGSDPLSISIGGVAAPAPYSQTNAATCTVIFNQPVGSGVGNDIQIAQGSQIAHSLPSFGYQYKAPVVSSVTTSATGGRLYCGGGSTLTVNGYSFGKGTPAPVVEIQLASGWATCSSPVMVVAHKQITCTAPAGQGVNLNVRVTVDTLASSYGTTAQWISYQAPTITLVRNAIGWISTWSTAGNEQLTIVGDNLGTSGTVTIGGGTRPCTSVAGAWTNQQVVCVTPAFGGINRDVTILVGSQTFTTTTQNGFVTYAPPSFTDMTPTNGPTAGSYYVVLNGANFAGVAGINTVTVARAVNAGTGVVSYSLCTPVAIDTPTQIKCLLPAGEGTLRAITIAAYTQNVTKSYFSYDAPTVSTLSVSNGPTSGNTLVSVTGSNFGIGVNLKVEMTVPGGSWVSQNSITWNSATSISFRTVANTGLNRPVRITVANQVALTQLPFSFDAPNITSVAKNGTTGACVNTNVMGFPAIKDCGIAENEAIKIGGINFGNLLSVVNVTVGGLACVVKSVTFTQIVFTLPTKMDGGYLLPITVLVDGQTITQRIVSFANPEVSDLTTTSVLPFGGTRTFNFQLSKAACTPTIANVWIGLPTSLAPNKEFAASGCTVSSCTSGVSAVQCTLPVGIVGAGLTLQAKVGLLTSPDSSVTLPAPAKRISTPGPAIVANTIRGSCDGPTGSNTYTASVSTPTICFNANYVGNLASLLSIQLYSADTGDTNNCNAIQITGTAQDLNRNVSCTAESGQGTNYKIQLTVLNQVSAWSTDVMHYPLPPTVYSISGCSSTTNPNATVNCPTDGTVNGTAVRLTVTGLNFGAEKQTLWIGTNKCKNLASVSDTKLTCDLPQGTGSNLPVMLVHGALFSKSVNLLSYLRATITGISGCDPGSTAMETINCPRKSAQVITLVGNNFGPNGARVLINGLPCTNVMHDAVTPNAKLTCAIPNGMGVGRGLMFMQSAGLLANMPTPTLSYQLCDPGSVFVYDGNLDCSLCDPGYEQPTPGQQFCTGCESGSYAPSAGTSSCLACPAGSISKRAGMTQQGPVSCQSCPVGQYQPTPGQDACLPCPAGSYTDQIGQSYCTPCPAGFTQSGEGQSFCSACAPGSFSPIVGQVACLTCSAGSYAAVTNSTECLDCAAGMYSSKSGAIACVSCSNFDPAGYSDQAGAQTCGICDPGTAVSVDRTQCVPCDAGSSGNGVTCAQCGYGYYSSSARSSSCGVCKAGSYAGSLTSTSCVDCPIGQYATTLASSACTQCATGTYVASEGNVACTMCDPGYYASVNGSSACVRCDPGTYSKDLGQPACTPCEVGKFAGALGAFGCDLCPSGVVANTTGMSSCLLCDAGWKAFYPQGSTGVGSTACAQCSPNTYTSAGGMTVCFNCPKGWHAPASGSTECSQCSVGTASLEGGDCVSCATGFFAPSNGSSTCAACSPGEYATGGASACTACELGRSQPNTQMSACNDCELGKYSGYTGQPTCANCPPGAMANQTGLITCFPCEKGTAQPANGGGYCPPCPLGQYADQIGSITCTLCPAGQYQDELGASYCKHCPAGNFTETIGKAFCTPCEKGKSSPEGHSFCTECEPGTYANRPDAGASLCLECAPGTYGKGYRLTSCTGCQPGYWSSAGKADCTQCVQNQVAPYTGMSVCYVCDVRASSNPERTVCRCGVGTAGKLLMDINYNRSNIQCFDCPLGANCNAIGLMADQVETMEGWWSVPGPAGEFRNFYRCMMPSYCKGGLNADCADGRTAPLCSLCLDGYTEAIGGTCRACGNAAGSWTVIVFVVLITIAVLWAMCYVVLRSSEVLFKAAEFEDKQRKKAVEGFVSDNTDVWQTEAWRFEDITVNGAPVPKPNLMFKMKIALSFLQVVTQQAVAVDIQWPTPFKTFISYFNPLNFDFLQLSGMGCQVSVDFYQRMQAFIIIPPCVIVAIILIVYGPAFVRTMTADKEVAARERKTARKKCWKLVFFLLFLMYPLVSASVLRVYVCRKVEGIEYLVADFSLQCKTDAWYSNANAAIIFIFVYPIGVPLFFFLSIWRYRNRLEQVGTRAQFDFLYDAYHHEFFYWELVDSMHKLFLVAIVAFFPFEAQMPVAISVVVLYTIAILVFKPFLRKGDDMLQLFSNIEIFCFFDAGLVFNAQITPDETMDIVLSVILIALFCVFIIYFIIQLVQVGLKLFKKQKADPEAEKKAKKFRDVDNDGLPVYHRDTDVNRKAVRDTTLGGEMTFERNSLIGVLTHGDKAQATLNRARLANLDSDAASGEKFDKLIKQHSVGSGMGSTSSSSPAESPRNADTNTTATTTSVADATMADFATAKPPVEPAKNLTTADVELQVMSANVAGSALPPPPPPPAASSAAATTEATTTALPPPPPAPATGAPPPPPPRAA